MDRTRDSEDEAVPLHPAGCLLAGGEGGLHVQRRAAGGSHQQLQGEISRDGEQCAISTYHYLFSRRFIFH